MDHFTEIRPKDIDNNIFKMIGSDWMLVSAGDRTGFNTMTASWGGFGILWHKNVCFIFIRPQRYTYEFIEKYDIFSLSFFSEDYRDVLKICGSCSGRDVDKIRKTGITPIYTDSGGIYFSEARTVMECRKIYYQDINPQNFLDAQIEENYPGKDYHRMYIGEILSCYVSR